MNAGPVTTKADHLKYLIPLGLLSALAGIGATIRASATDAAAASNTMTPCASSGDLYELDVPGTYSTFAIASIGAVPTHVRGSHGEILATTDPSTDNMAPIDLASGARFGIAPPQVFELTSDVMIHVESPDAPYELIIVRLGEDGNESRIDIRPPVERVLNESGSCLIGDLREYSRVRIDTVYSDLNAREVFVVESAAGDADIDAQANIDAHVEG